SSGAIEMDGRLMSSAKTSLPPEKRQMSMIFQSYAVWPNMTIGENVAFGLKLRRLDRETVALKVREVLETVQLAHLADRYPAELSGGQQQRVALARAMVIQPRVLLLDEPLSNLDANLREEMRFEIRRLHDTFHFTTVYVTHDQGEAMVTSDRIAVMNKGRIEQIDAPYAIYNRPRTRFVAGFIGRTNFVEAACEGSQVLFDGFALPRAAFDAGGDGLGRSALFSVRPQSIRLHRASAVSREGVRFVAGEIVERAYLGESWDYVAAPAESALRLKVSAPPVQIFEVGEKVWLEFDPRQMAPIA
ncbi:MAG TPA: ABC transporter ATP-binding protein, partial [Stellaceae bacterium]|nr:ABC transporter ATP-binding protein [Stellaceae bacterium]